MPRELCNDDEISRRLTGLKGWTRVGSALRKTIECADFIHAIGLVTSIAMLAETLDHHPDIDIRWNKVTLVLSTHSAGGLTDLDFTLAEQIDAL